MYYLLSKNKFLLFYSLNLFIKPRACKAKKYCSNCGIACKIFFKFFNTDVSSKKLRWYYRLNKTHDCPFLTAIFNAAAICLLLYNGCFKSPVLACCNEKYFWLNQIISPQTNYYSCCLNLFVKLISIPKICIASISDCRA